MQTTKYNGTNHHADSQAICSDVSCSLTACIVILHQYPHHCYTLPPHRPAPLLPKLPLHPIMAQTLGSTAMAVITR